MAKVVADIAVQVGADVTSLSKGFAKAGKDTRKFERDFEQSSQRMKISAEKMGAALAAAGFAAAGGMAALLRATAENAKELQNLSRIAGTNVEDFQKLAFAAKQYGVEQDKLSDILKDTNDKIGDFMATGAGPMADFFENIGPKVGVTADQFRNLNSADALQLYVSSLEKANVSHKELVFYMEALASDASALVPLLANGGAEMGRLADHAEDLGIILDEKSIRGTERLNEVWNAAMDSMKVKFFSFATTVAIGFDSIFGITEGSQLRIESEKLSEYADKRIEALGVLEKATKKQQEFESGAANGAFTLGRWGAEEYQKEVDQAQAVVDAINEEMNVINDGILKVQENIRRREEMEAQLQEMLDRPGLGDGDGDGDGGGGRSRTGPSEADLERLQEGLMSENELLIADYEKKLALLAEFREQKKITEEQYNQLEQDLTSRHLQSLSQIEAAAAQNRINAVLGAGSEILSSLGSTNDKAFKMAKVFNSGMALMDAWGAYNKVLNDPTPQPWFVRMSAAASVLASAIGAVNSIKSATMGGGGGQKPQPGGSAAGGATSSSSGGSSAAPQQDMYVHLQGQMFSGASIANMLNEAIENGAQIKGVTYA